MTKLLPIALILALSACGTDRDDNNSNEPIVIPPVDPVDPVDPKGKRLSTECDGTTVVREFADGEGGSYFEREENWEACGYSPTSVEVVTRQGDYWKPVVIEVTGTDEWDFEIEAGHATRTDTGVEITSDGQVGSWNITIAGEQYVYELVNPPLCENTLPTAGGKYKTTCDGVLTGRSAASMIWYGEEDTQIVTIEVGVMRPVVHCTVGDCVEGMPISPDQPDNMSGGSYTIQENVDRWIEGLNAFNVRNKVYIRFELSALVWGRNWSDLPNFVPTREILEISDVVIGYGPSGEAGGKAYMPRSIYERMSTPIATSVTIGGRGLLAQGTATHEIGHAMGLGHGVWGDPDWDLETGANLGQNGGSIFPRFGHGWMGRRGESICASHGSVMSYSDGYAWSNSLNTCEELGSEEWGRDNLWNGVAGSRTQTDEAYALNRVRYSYSLIHNEHKEGKSDVEASPLIIEEESILIVD